MADFPSNLIDGELFLPSDILSDENSAKIRPPTRFPSELTYVEALAERCSPTARLGHQTKNNNPPCSNTQLWLFQGKPFLQFGTFNPNQIGMGFQIQFGTFDPNGIGSVANGGVCRGNGIVHNVHHASERVDYHNDLTSGYQLQHTEPVYSQNESFGHEARGKVLHNEQNKGRNHFSPFQTTGGGFQKGTGVFFPRVAGTTMEASKENGAYDGRYGDTSNYFLGGQCGDTSKCFPAARNGENFTMSGKIKYLWKKKGGTESFKRDEFLSRQTG